MPNRPDWAKDINYTANGISSNHPLAARWRMMIHRCYNPKKDSYKYYGGRGITVHPKLQSLAGYIEEIEKLGPKPSPEHTIDRINNDLGYQPGNIRWASKEEQMNNRRNNVVLTIRGVSQSAAAWSNEVGISKKTIILRKWRGWSDHEALLVPHGGYSDFRCSIDPKQHVYSRKNILFNGEPRFLEDVAEELGISPSALKLRRAGRLDQAA